MKKIFLTFLALLLTSVSHADSALNYGGGGVSDSNLRSGNVNLDDIPNIIVAVTSFILRFVGSISVFMILVGAIFYVFSGVSGDKSKGKNIILYAIVGAIISWSAWFIINFVLGNV